MTFVHHPTTRDVVYLNVLLNTLGSPQRHQVAQAAQRALNRGEIKPHAGWGADALRYTPALRYWWARTIQVVHRPENTQDDELSARPLAAPAEVHLEQVVRTAFPGVQPWALHLLGTLGAAHPPGDVAGLAAKWWDVIARQRGATRLMGVRGTLPRAHDTFAHLQKVAAKTAPQSLNRARPRGTRH
ncbi:hypothetical protein LAJ19_21455 (plasmid) [Deinococcus taeanensis]|uniref:hypothetical protein n=1 Tax=Deinococcus taeanensis TaxID=2737050 RepID=UPI001CDCAC75|nr:hypothetical protein [Deinococcus taeanensis]UBV45552.1 hypothetical protein LAJ19_21455 [Deinococcus taeanensis]